MAAGEGLIQLRKIPGHKFPYVRLTDASEVQAQFLAACGGLIDVWPWDLFNAIIQAAVDRRFPKNTFAGVARRL